ncbi:cupin domain-containing protein [Phycisphaerales bacterium AB-hyl4]|uniref:Cupin domain-containing protein n=1 Tax=Natronomicrosphaera hydrolytica TaxID=3242702 RepID=A0ABV4U1N8_9BACT
MQRTAWLLMATASLTLGCEGLQSPAGLDHVHEVAAVTPEQVAWSPAPEVVPEGAELAVLEGDPAEAEPFVVRMRMPDGYNFPAHSHPHAERVTVIEGTMHLAMGHRLDRDAAEAYPTGSYVAIPTDEPHQVWAEEQLVIQVTGVGPLEVDYVDPADDPRTGQTAAVGGGCPLCQLAAASEPSR